MPTYEYRCRDCGHSFDIVQKMSDDPLTHCPECGGGLRKVFAPPAISFKGSGFYATDHGKKAKQSGREKRDGDGLEGTGGVKRREGSKGGVAEGGGAEGVEGRSTAPRRSPRATRRASTRRRRRGLRDQRRDRGDRGVRLLRVPRGTPRR